ncbi:hypothetical protein [Parafannyhessea umbonata]|uniref:Uncharacterized protein n=1 Tax=Parafannyhessea umbonata TaxID=604330 RepID=A0A6N7WS33_9ACTN|nr:hypothetical protein [Parafannyhessea umbonata]MCI6681098.1 hypothetical protein [Parafannyhessea umbonata]MCI7219530.1 hypothetical protein [Parafannyhessea umbonata]MDD6359968.1 hypothetical protein [Parafannyhessea umbonata]MDD6565818.1 hypothetical protein [Parafannyhessea umbonata]MDD6602355.1 hypothetical protein [Parafannyhessea umbonata]
MRIKDMSKRQRRVFDACSNGWFVSGVYTAMFDDHKRDFAVDSLGMLYGGVENWFGEHATNHGDSHLLVKCVKAL